MSDRSDSIQTGDSLDHYLDKVSHMNHANDRLVNSYRELGSSWERIAAALESIASRDHQAR